MITIRIIILGTYIYILYLLYRFNRVTVLLYLTVINIRKKILHFLLILLYLK